MRENGKRTREVRRAGARLTRLAAVAMTLSFAQSSDAQARAWVAKEYRQALNTVMAHAKARNEREAM